MENEKIQKGSIRAICISPEKGTVKRPVESARFIENYGIEGDAHAGKWHRQVSLLAAEAVEAFYKLKNNRKSESTQSSGDGVGNGTVNDAENNTENGTAEMSIRPGDFGENILTEGLDLHDIPCGTLVRSGDVILKITQRGKECHTGCRIREATGECIMPREGVFAEVIRGGILKPSDPIELEMPEENRAFSAAVITMSDKASRGEREDKSGPRLSELLRSLGIEVTEELVLPDEASELKNNLIRLADRRDTDLIITTGGTGFSQRDVTPEATLAVATRNAPGIAEAIRAGSLKITPRAMLSRGVSVIRNKTLIINFPGSPKAVEESFEIIRDVLPHALGILTGRDFECGR